MAPDTSESFPVPMDGPGGGAIGGEYRAVAQISIGGEAKIEYLHTSASSSGAGTVSVYPDLVARNWYSTGALVVRFYP